MSNNFCYEFPVVRGHQAGRIFYMATVPMRVVQNMFKLDTGDGSALSRSQREVNLVRAKKFSEYLKQNKESFVLPALTGFVNVDRDMNVEFKESNIENVGTLSVPMDAALLFVDGQHRASGVAIAMEDSDTRVELGSHSAPVMLFESLTLQERQSMFSDINGNVAKPAQALSDTYNNRDEMALFAKELAANIPQLIDMVDFERNVVSVKSTYLFSIKTIKEVSATVAGIKKNSAPTEENKALITRFWKSWFEGIGFDEKFSHCVRSAQRLKEESIITTGVILKAAALAVKEAGIDNVDFSILRDIDWSRNSAVFHGRCVDANLKTMKADATATKLTAAKLLSMMKIDLNEGLSIMEEKVFGELKPIEVEVESTQPEDQIETVEQPQCAATEELPDETTNHPTFEWNDENLPSTLSDWRAYVGLNDESTIMIALNFSCKRHELTQAQQFEASEKLSIVSSEGDDADYIRTFVRGDFTDEEVREIYFRALRDFLFNLDNSPEVNDIHKSLLNIRTIRGEVKRLALNIADIAEKAAKKQSLYI